MLEMVQAFSDACGKPLPHAVVDRRPGDAAEVYAAPALAEKVLGWKAKLNIADICRDQWNWASKNPYGYEDAPADK